MRTKLWMTLMKIFLVFLGILGVAAGISQLDTPSPRSASPEGPDFSAEIALTHLKVIAREPHPTGSLAIKQVRDYLVSELNEQGLEVDVQKELVFDTILGTKLVQATYVENVIGRLPGLSEGNGIALVAHYDSVYSSPGAIDDGAGVASILETLPSRNTAGDGIYPAVFIQSLLMDS